MKNLSVKNKNCDFSSRLLFVPLFYQRAHCAGRQNEQSVHSVRTLIHPVPYSLLIQLSHKHSDYAMFYELFMQVRTFGLNITACYLVQKRNLQYSNFKLSQAHLTCKTFSIFVSRSRQIHWTYLILVCFTTVGIKLSEGKYLFNF